MKSNIEYQVKEGMLTLASIYKETGEIHVSEAFENLSEIKKDFVLLNLKQMLIQEDVFIADKTALNQLFVLHHNNNRIDLIEQVFGLLLMNEPEYGKLRVKSLLEVI